MPSLVLTISEVDNSPRYYDVCTHLVSSKNAISAAALW